MNKRIVKLKHHTRTASLEKRQAEFVANVSHELKTPLTIIKTYTETLLSGTVDDRDMVMSMLNRIDFEADHMRDLVRDLLIFAKLESNTEDMIHKRLKLKPLMDSVLARGTERAEHNGLTMELHYNADPELIISADKTKLEQALLNICANSINYTDQGGKVSLIVDADDSSVRIRIADTGIGISEEDLPHIFERFYRVDKARSRATGGTGLGLPIAKEYVEAHGGSIAVESVLGEGTTITVDLPSAVDHGEEDG